jgi:hypothetical protein
MVDEASNTPAGSPQAEHQVEAGAQPSSEQIIQALIGTETKADGNVTDLINKLVGGDEFIKGQEDK